MKKLILASIITLVTQPSFSAIVNSARIDDAKQNILVDVSYGGGCQEHIFELEMGMCLETNPVQCSARLVETSEPDFCEAFISQTISIPLAKYNLNDSYFSGGSLSILGDLDWQTGEDSVATVILP